jgi:hypothetical protein
MKNEYWKLQEKKCQVTSKDKPIRITDFSAEILKAKKADVFQALKQNNCQPRLLYPVRLSFKTKEKIKTFHEIHDH